ncbi:hypothetical protein, partial [Salmonella enterica]|uniref:hypothetical protein n=1 Tax=Salmonella enterica TaxID=28901 RepID=UPI001CB8657F
LFPNPTLFRFKEGNKKKAAAKSVFRYYEKAVGDIKKAVTAAEKGVPAPGGFHSQCVVLPGPALCCQA